MTEPELEALHETLNELRCSQAHLGDALKELADALLVSRRAISGLISMLPNVDPNRKEGLKLDASSGCL